MQLFFDMKKNKTAYSFGGFFKTFVKESDVLRVGEYGGE